MQWKGSVLTFVKVENAFHLTNILTRLLMCNIPESLRFIEEVKLNHNNLWSSTKPLDCCALKSFNPLTNASWGSIRRSTLSPYHLQQHSFVIKFHFNAAPIHFASFEAESGKAQQSHAVCDKQLDTARFSFNLLEAFCHLRSPFN